MRFRGSRAGWIALAGVVLGSVAAAQPVLDRDVTHYTILGMRRVRLKNFGVEPGGCHIGVNCPHPKSNAACGMLFAKDASFGPIAQVVGDAMCATGHFYQVFRNNVGTPCGPVCSMVASPGPSPDCTTPFAPPVIGDLDQDGTPSCSGQCTVDAGDVAAACGVSVPFPACDPGRAVFVVPDTDCGVEDVVPGNFQCDLAPGTYGAIIVRNGARLSFGAGTTVACSLRAGRATRIKSAGPAHVLVPGSGTIKINNALDVGTTCGTLLLATERGLIHFGRNGDVTADACAVAGRLKLGHANNLRGRFIGQDVGMDLDNDGRCCTPPVPTSSTTTTSTTSAPTTTSAPGGSTTTSTTNPGATTSTTNPGATTSTTSVGATTSTTSTTLPAHGFTRTIGFYKTHPAVTAQILAEHGPLMVCGRAISDVDVGHAHSALEALCGSPRGNQRLQLVRQLMGAALTTAAGGAQFDATACNAVCVDPAATIAGLTACIDAADAFNNGGDSVVAPWDPAGAANSAPCDAAAATPCTLLDPSACSAP